MGVAIAMDPFQVLSRCSGDQILQGGEVSLHRTTTWMTIRMSPKFRTKFEGFTLNSSGGQ